jgi:sodium-coupled neutral amino acid transporter 11
MHGMYRLMLNDAEFSIFFLVANREAWAKSIGENTAWIPNVIVLFKTWSACLIYSIIIGDLFNDLAITAGISQIGGIDVTRTSIIVATHLFGLLPLCLLRSFSWLSYASLFGVGGILFTAGFMLLRLFEGSYLPGGEFFQALTSITAAGAPPVVVSSFDVKGTSLLKSVILVSTLTSSYLCHYNAPKFLRELKDATTARSVTGDLPLTPSVTAVPSRTIERRIFACGG